MKLHAESLLWCCPRCREPLSQGEDVLRCESCRHDYDVIGGIPDLRVAQDCWIDIEADRREARDLAERSPSMSLEELIRHAYCTLQPDANEARIERRVREILARPELQRANVKKWLNEYTNDEDGFLDLGCGSGTLLAGAAAEGRKGVGIDVSMMGLMIADRFIRKWGGTPVLAAAMGENLPLADGTFQKVLALDIIEHVADPAPFLREIDRITKPGGSVVVTTPNRYSLTVEPHVFVFGVGFIPRRWQKSYVKFRSGQSYDFVRLMSSWEIARLFRDHTQLECQIVVPAVPEEQIARFTSFRARLAKLYNRLVSANWTRFLFLGIGPFFRVIGRKPL